MSQTPASSLEDSELLKYLETLLFITDRPLTLDELRKLTGVKDKERLSAQIAQLRSGLEERGSAIQLLEIAGGFQMATKPVYAPLVRKLFSDKMTMRLSTAAHETLAIIAYKQPLTRAEIEQIRGVEVIASLETLLEKRLIKVVGRKESVGRPLMYGTTEGFMRHFGLKSLEELPPVESLQPQEESPLPKSSEDSSVAGESFLPPSPSEVVAPDGASESSPESTQPAGVDEPAAQEEALSESSAQDSQDQPGFAAVSDADEKTETLWPSDDAGDESCDCESKPEDLAAQEEASACETEASVGGNEAVEDGRTDEPDQNPTA